MKSKIKLFIAVFLLSFACINCEHCDDEDYRREDQENLTTKQADTLTFSK